MKEELFHHISNESRISDGDKEKHESIFKLETPHQTKDNNILEQPIIDFNELWFQIIVVQEIQSGFGYIWFNFILVYFVNALESLVEALICSSIIEIIPQITCML
jgi:hypothetical protein